MSATTHRSLWRYYPWFVVAAFVVVIAVNGGMVWSALATFPGAAVTNDFDHSNHYDAVLAAAAREAALGWQVTAEQAEGHPVLLFAARDGSPLTQARIAATARRPLGPDEAVTVTFHESAPGRYVADAALPRPGQWELLLAVTRGADTLHAAPRVVVR